jgi:hypothetical protein
LILELIFKLVSEVCFRIAHQIVTLALFLSFSGRREGQKGRAGGDGRGDNVESEE